MERFFVSYIHHAEGAVYENENHSFYSYFLEEGKNNIVIQ